jgi:tetratricopeptide (TPR) repeat protein
MAKKKNVQPDSFESVENALSKTEQYIEDNQKSLTIIVAAIVVIVGGYFGYQKFYVNPMENEAQSQMFVAEQYFEKDSFNLALYGDGNYFGFIDIIDEYGVTKAANLANYYAGISYLHLGDYEAAIDYLKGFESDDHIISSMALGAIGDAHSELGELENAISFYIKAANNNSNDFTTPIYLMKAAQVYESLEDFSKALDIYDRVKEEFPRSNEARHIDKYITRANRFLNS